ncbi:MAG: hypothetical protein LAN18_14675 [Acidobacteriia bacterium]|nr:hypothetical protein [Terriglobia bacterium]
MFEPAFAQIRRAQPVPPVCRKGEEREYALELLLELLHHLRRGPPPTRTEPPQASTVRIVGKRDTRNALQKAAAATELA